MRGSRRLDSLPALSIYGLIAVVIVPVLGGSARADQFVPFMIPGETHPASLIAQPLPAIGVDAPRVAVSGEHFVRNGERIRIWGVNTSFGANFPVHARAEQMAERLAAMGINSVRLHHMDTSWWPNGLWDPSDGATVYAPALARLDFFIHQLAQHGIWVNLNLHVGREHSDYVGLPDPGTDYDKIVGIFTPSLIAAQQSFAGTVLNHVNPYRGVRYADDPAIAFVEITNEDSFFMWNGDASLRSLSSYYADLLQALYNEWLLARYGNRSVLEVAWAEGVEPPGNNLLANGDFQAPGGSGVPDHWNLEQHGTSAASATVTQYDSVDCLRLDVASDDGIGWHLQINQPGLTVTAGQYYTVSFDAAATAARSVGVSLMQAHDPWQNLGLGSSVSLTPAWQSFRFGFVASADDANARVNFTFGGESASVYLGNVEMRPGGQQGLLAVEDPAAGSVALFVDAPGNPREMDRLRFLAETEKDYFDSMRAHVRNVLGCDALVTGTIVFGPLGLYAQRDMDFVDAHAYWRHPTFPGAPWDPSNWIIEQDAMSDDPAGATLFPLAAQRLAGKPFTVSEYNHAAPNDYQAECIPMIASFAAAQDWDGIWIYSYAHSAEIEDDGYFHSFFDVASNPAKLGFLRAGRAIFTDGGLGALGAERLINLATTGDPLGDAASLRMFYGDDLWRAVQAETSVVWQDLLGERLRISFGPAAPQPVGSNASLAWAIPPAGGIYSAAGDAAWAFSGWANLFAVGTQNRMTVAAPAFAAVTVSSLDGLPFDQSHTVLVTAGGRSENVNMVFSADRRTVNTNWGEAARIEAVDGTLRLPPGRWTCRRLAADGTAVGQVATTYASGFGELVLDASHGTIWYLLDRARGDVDGDGDVDGADAVFLPGCLTGPGLAPLSGCDALDISGDHDVDLEDFTLFQQAFAGPSR